MYKSTFACQRQFYKYPLLVFLPRRLTVSRKKLCCIWGPNCVGPKTSTQEQVFQPLLVILRYQKDNYAAAHSVDIYVFYAVIDRHVHVYLLA